MTTLSLSLNQTAEAVEALIDVCPVFLWGAPGIGKTSIVHAIGKKLNREVIDWRANLREPVDARGLPVVDAKTRTTVWARPNDLPFEGSEAPENAIVFLDELNTASPAMQVVAMQLVHERRVGEHRLKKDVRIVAAGNRTTDRAAVNVMTAPLADRFAHIEAKPCPKEFSLWAAEMKMHPIIPAFIRFRPNLLMNMDSGDKLRFPTPRSWEKVAKIVDLKHAMQMTLIASIIGDGAAAEFEGFIRIFEALPSLEKILKSPATAKVPGDDRVAERYALSCALARAVDQKTFANGLQYAARLSDEFAALFVTDAARRDKSVCDTDAYVEWAVKNQQVMA